MKKFVLKTALFIFIPTLFFVGIYVWTDPFKLLRPFSFQYFDNKNREHQSLELLKYNKGKNEYNSFLFGSCRLNSINSYHWKHYLPEGSNPFVFQAWGETIFGVRQKIDYLVKENYEIRNVLILLDVPGGFLNTENSADAVTKNHYELSGNSALEYHWYMAKNIFKPSYMVECVKEKMSSGGQECIFDTVSNDFDTTFFKNWMLEPQKDSLRKSTPQQREDFFNKIMAGKVIPEQTDLLDEDGRGCITHIAEVLKEKSTNVLVIISPNIEYKYPAISVNDLSFLKKAFGEECVYDFSRDNYLSHDYNCYYDPDHFGRWAGWYIIENIYK